MAVLKDRRAAHRLVAEVLWSYMRKQQPSPVELDAPGVRAEVEKIREAHFAVGIIKDELPEAHEVEAEGSLASGGVRRCQSCGTDCPVCAERAKPKLEARIP